MLVISRLAQQKWLYNLCCLESCLPAKTKQHAPIEIRNCLPSCGCCGSNWLFVEDRTADKWRMHCSLTVGKNSRRIASIFGSHAHLLSARETFINILCVFVVQWPSEPRARAPKRRCSCACKRSARSLSDQQPVGHNKNKTAACIAHIVTML